MELHLQPLHCRAARAHIRKVEREREREGENDEESRSEIQKQSSMREQHPRLSAELGAALVSRQHQASDQRLCLALPELKQLVK